MKIESLFDASKVSNSSISAKNQLTKLFAAER